jgi:hypothetical protein
LGVELGGVKALLGLGLSIRLREGQRLAKIPRGGKKSPA